jgi:peptidoglycan hydrolase CwlO-like protein
VGRLARIWVTLGVLSLVVGFAGSAGARTAEGEWANRGGEAPILEAKVEDQRAMLREQIDKISAVGAELEATQAWLSAARERTERLEEQRRALERALDARRETYEAAKPGYEEKARAAYEGASVESLSSFLGGLLGSTESQAGLAVSREAEILLEGQESLADYRGSRRSLEITLRRISIKTRDYKEALREKSLRARELRSREAELKEYVARISSDKERMAARLLGLQEAERARALEQRAATGVGETSRAAELSVSRREKFAEPVEPLSKKGYMRLYRAAAREYGFGKDWYVLAAVGMVESNHGENMGTSSAGTMGPMQFLPSTWETAGVDGNGDGEANIMDPRDAIPAAAGYLRSGGAPRDWYRALFTYNHADWYVLKVLGVAEGYRRLADDDTVGPYI